jgi:hypothetical protein
MVEVETLQARAVVEAAYPHADTGKVYYAVKVIELDAGFMSVLERCSRARHPVVNVCRSCPLLTVMYERESIVRVADPSR